MSRTRFEWDLKKEMDNILKHGISFTYAAKAFKDPKQIIAKDEKHSSREKRYFCIGKIDSQIVTVRFTYRNKVIRIYGAGCWRKGKSLYEKP